MMQHKLYFATLVLATLCALATGCIAEFADAATNVSVILRTASVGVALLATLLSSIATLRFAGADFGRVELSCSMLGCSQFFGLIGLGLNLLQSPEIAGELATYSDPFTVVLSVFILLNVRFPFAMALTWACSLMAPTKVATQTPQTIIMWVHLCLTCYMPYLQDHRLALLAMVYLYNCVGLGPTLLRVHSKSLGLAEGCTAAFNIVFAYVIYLFVRRLDRIFPQSCAGACSQGALSFFSSIWRGVCHGGSDVLVFFDFSGLPQIGKTHDGTEIPRTDAEVAQFQEALPSMGVLYTMFPVLVLLEVSCNVHPYFSSGWCSSEFYSAMLANQLAPFSTEAVAAYADYLAQGSDASGPMMSRRTLESLCVGTLDPSAVDDFNTAFERDLETKKFFDENDRTAVRDIVQGFLLKRLLADAVLKQDAHGVKKLLEKFQANDMIETLGQPVDDSLDTLLHRAVRLPSVEIVQALLEAGGSPLVLNLRGDTPAQFFAMPRVTAGARLCRSRQGNQAQQQYAAVVTI